MQWFYNMKIAKKLILSFLLVAAIALTIGFVGFNGIKVVGDVKMPSIHAVMVISEAQTAVDAAENALLAKGISAENRAAAYKRFDDAKKRADDAWKTYEPLPQTKEEAEVWKKFVPAWEKWWSDHEEFVRMAKEYEKNPTEELYSKMTAQALNTNGISFSAAETLLGQIIEINDTSGEDAVNSSQTLMIVFMIAGLIISILLGLFISRIIANPLKDLAEKAERLAQGDVSINVETNTTDEVGDLTRSFGKVIESLQGLVAESGMLTKAAVDGKLDTRGNAVKFQGAYRDIVQGVNDTLDAVIGPLNVAAEYVDRISKGDIPQKIADSYNGDFNAIKNNLNRLVDTMNAIIDRMDEMYQSQKAGDIEAFIEEAQFDGVYRKMVTGVNEGVKLHITAVLKILDIIGSYADGDFSKVLEKLPGKQVIANERMDKIRNNLLNLITDANMLSNAAVEGHLATRADATKHQGDFRKVVQGVNDTLDAVIQPVNEAVEVISSMADGDLTVKVAGEYHGDHAKMKDALNRTLEALNEILGQVNTASEQVVSGAAQVSDSSQSLSQGATESASSLEEITSSMTEMTSQTKQNAENAQQANKLAAAARDNAEQGNSRMGQMLEAMGEINESSSQISKIIKVIDEIAFQTNLLALNAAVEAARAGVHGKGFAVVADEVRNLAQRSAKAAKETTELIETSIKKVENGTGIANETAKALNEIVSGVTKVTDLVSEIASASNEQAQGIGQVNQGLGQIDSVTQANTANAEESAAAAEELSGQASQLKQMLTRFRINGNSSSTLREYHQPARIETGGNGGNGKHAVKKSVVHKGAYGRKFSPGNGTGGSGDPVAVIALDDDDFGSF